MNRPRRPSASTIASSTAPCTAHTADPSAAAGDTVTLRLLGDPALLGADGSIKALERRAAGLLALVALEPGVTRARAAMLLWPESDNARQALRQQLARFRKHYGAQLIDGDDALVLSSQVTVDVLSTLHDARDAPRAATGTLLGDLAFDDCEDFDAWLAQQRDRLRGGVASALSQRIAQAEADGDLDAALRLAEQLVLADNDSESHHRTLMRLHYLRGDIAQAQAAYARLARQLAQRFGARPSAETEQLARALRAAQQPAVAATPTTAAASRPVPVTVLRPPRMIGRARELSALGDAWSQGRGALLLGEPGLGKSRLLAEFAAGRRVLGVQGRPGDAGVPYATLSRLLRTILDHTRVELPTPRRTELSRLLPELAPTLPLPADGQRLLLQGAIEAVLAQARDAGVDGIVIDDLHFADDASVEMLQALICSDVAGPLAGLRWALAQRPGEGSSAAAALRAALEEAQALDVLPLAPLTVDEMAALIDSLGLPELDSAQLAPQLTRHTGGNPLYALETLKQGLASGLLRQGRLPTPTHVGALIERRLKQLSERALALARVAAIAGVDFSIALAEEVMGVRAVELADAWSELEAAQVLREQAFAHDLVFDAVLRSVPAAIGRHLHAELAGWLEARHGEVARIAAHWEAAQQSESAAHAWVEAARVADARLRYREAMQCYERAAAHYAALGDANARYAALKGALDEASMIDIATTAYVALIDQLVAAAPGDAQRAEALLYRLRQLEQAGDHAATLRLCDEVEALSRLSEQPRTEAMSLCARAGAMFSLGQLGESAALYQRIGDFGAQIGDPELEGFGHSSRATVLLRLCRHEAALASFEHARSLYERTEMWMRLVLVDQQMSIAQTTRGYAQEGLVAAERALRQAARIEIALDLMGNCVVAQVLALRALGRYGEALAALEGMLPPLVASGTWMHARLQVELAQLYVDLGRLDLAQRLAAQVRDGGRLPPGEAPRLVALELQLRAGNDAATALSLTQNMQVEARRRCELLRLLAAAPDCKQPQAHLDQALRVATDNDLPHERCTSRAFLARHLADAGQTGAAAELMRTALEDATVVPAGYPPAVAECAVAVFSASGDFARRDSALSGALAWIERAAAGLSDELRQSFFQRNEVNRRLLAQARATPRTAAARALP